ncbi:MAG: TolC family protein [Candidatus Binatus sp.]|uniref:TolC family protein n=1 Tax=Candidatus Binatus sp. TaxID=2811406 RepID=UPI003BAE964F
MPTIRIGGALMFAIATVGFLVSNASAADAPLSKDQLVEIAIEANPAVKSARYRWDAAVHSIKQTVAPNDPIFTYSNTDSVSNPFGRPDLHSFGVTESFQFPGKAFHQRDQAIDAAEIAHLMLAATVRDVRAATEISYFQLVLDQASYDLNAENVENLDQVVRVAETAYSASAVQQTDVISAEFNLATARQFERQYRTAVANDKTALNLELYRPVGSPLAVDQTLKLEALNYPLDALIDRAYAARQEILEAALSQRSANTALYLAKMEYLPDFTAGIGNDQYTLSTAGPQPNKFNYWFSSIGFNVPIFFWLHQNEDVARAKASLAAARSSQDLIRIQTAAAVTTLFRNAQYAYETAILYRDSLIPLARQNLRVALTAYQGGKIDFTTLSTILQSGFAARVNYLQAANQFLAGEVSLEQAIGAPLHQ